MPAVSRVTLPYSITLGGLYSFFRVECPMGGASPSELSFPLISTELKGMQQYISRFILRIDQYSISLQMSDRFAS